MTDDLLSKDNTSVAKPAERTKPTLVTIGDKTIISGGRWNDSLMADYVSEYGQDEWITVGHLAKVACGSNTIPNKKRVRARLSSLFSELRGRGLWLAVEYGGDHNAATAVKIANPKMEEDCQSVEAKLASMLRRKELTQEQYLKASALFHAMQAP